MSDQEKRKPIRDLYKAFMENPDHGKEALVCRLQNLKESWVADRDKTMAKQWRMNVAFYSGNHYIRDNGSGGTQYRVKVKENHINNTLSRILSIVTQNIPIVRVFPETSSYQDVQDSENCESYLKFFWRTKGIEKKLMALEKYALIFGNAFAYTRYNPDQGGQIVLGSEVTENGDKIVTEYRGDIETQILDPFKVIVRPGIESWCDHYDVIIQSIVSKEFIADKFGIKALDNAMVLNPYSGEMRYDEDSVILNEYYHKPTPWFEDGMYASWVGKELVKCRPAAPHAEKQLPIKYLGFDKIPMRFYANSAQDQLQDMQEQLNRAASFIIEARNLVSRPRVFASHQSKVAAQSLTDRPGDIVRYDAAGGPPQFVVPQFNFGELAAHKADLRSALGAVSGITSASRGEVPAATRTALALQLVMENDRSVFAPHIKEFFECIQGVANDILMQAAEYFSPDDPRVIKIEGKTSQVRTFHGGMVPSDLDLHLEDVNPLGWTAGARIENIQSLAQMGVLKDPNQILEMLKINSADPAYELQNTNRVTQQKENEELNQGKPVEIGPADMHDVHINEMDKIMASYEFKKKPNLVKAAFIAHKQAHEDAMKQKMMEAQAAMQPSASPLSGALDGAADQLTPPVPGADINELLLSSRAG